MLLHKEQRDFIKVDEGKILMAVAPASFERPKPGRSFCSGADTPRPWHPVCAAK
jgi:hypothetical protein